MPPEWTFTLLTDGGPTVPVLPEHDPPDSGVVAEGRQMRFRLAGPGFDPWAAEVVVNDELLTRQVLREGGANPVEWAWMPEFRAGTAVVELRNVDGGPFRQEITVDPDAAKLERAEYEAMLLDILRDTAALADRAGCRLGVSRGDRHLGIATLELIRSRLRRIEKAVRAIDRNPWRHITRTPRQTTLGRAGAVGPQELERGLRDAVPVDPARTGHLSPELRVLAARLKWRLPGRVERPAPTVDHRRREHSDILAALGVIGSFLTGARAAIEAIPERTPDQDRLADLARHLARRVRRLTTLELFRDVQPTRGAIRPSHLFLRVPGYRQFYAAWRETRDGLADITGEFLQVPLQRTWALYELWCFLRMARAASTIDPDAGDWRAAFREQVSRDCLILNLEKRPLDFGGFRLVFQPTYTEVWKRHGAATGSYSRKMEPDIAVEGFGVHTEDPKPIIVLDAKYRVEEAINDAILSTHTYRDALVYCAGPPYTDRRHLVRVALVLVPKVPSEFVRQDDWREQETPDVFFREEYREAFGFGALVLTPGMGDVDIVRVLRELLGRAGPPANGAAVASPRATA
jgi:hypothetical protein